MIIAGQIKDLIASVYDRNNGKKIATGPMLAIIRLESNDADDGKFWNGSSWETTPASFPSASHIEVGQWLYTLPIAASTGKVNSFIHFTFTDDLDEDQSDVVSGGGEQLIRAEDPLVTSDVRVYEGEPDLR